MTPDNRLTTPDFDKQMTRRALELAARGIGLTSPGPLVGCLIVDDNCAVVGEGSYDFENVSHAETIALAQAGARARGATAYISLEPHAHHGRTPPCTNALIDAGIKRVVAPIEDPNPKVSGRGFAHLRKVGVEICDGVMADEAARLNEAYIHFMRTGRPFVHLKLAVSLDGKIATRTGDSRWIAGEQARARAHELRHQYDSILIGSETLLADNPLLTDRSGRPRRRPLVRVILDDRLRLPSDYQLSQTAREVPVLLFTSSDAESSSDLKQLGVEMLRIEGGARDLVAMLNELGKREIQSVLVEGGGTVAGALLDAELVNKVTFFIAPMIIGGLNAPTAVAGIGASRIKDAFQLEDVEVSQRGRDFEITGYPKSVPPAVAGG
ncbi:MAG TPA: bifunctional diaminohydroxyphosphoribosylaminopyrimidine deaminase/5-amino-6-(5-phosphoribosylamino)uracil reductase RibD [Pyrinomonadaceae bacterium]|nr:bifunctional diaminohydroxyphosphoribosylaminopyrimidine deaminase/5-amino-6-(5-phosphoribosylamino)uracil reductase RibD [Pyrinomonadaceae bacterium]